MGIIYAGIMLNPGMKLTFIFFPFFDIPGYVFGVGYLLYSMYGMKKQLGNIGHSAHLGGAIGGFVLVDVVENLPELLHQWAVTAEAVVAYFQSLQELVEALFHHGVGDVGQHDL